MKSYSVLQSTTYGECVKVKAKNEDEAIKKVENGDYYDEDIISTESLIEINLNIFLRTILLTFSFYWFTYLSSKIGEEYIAANTILINLIFLSAFILDSYAFSTEGIIGFSIGKKNKKLFLNTVKNSFILSSFTGAAISFIYYFVNNIFINFMTDIESVKIISYQFSIWLILLPFISSFCYQFDGIFIGASQTRELRDAMFISVIFYLLSSYFLVQNFGNNGLWISFTMFLFLRALTLGFYFKRIYLKF